MAKDRPIRDIPESISQRPVYPIMSKGLKKGVSGSISGIVDDIDKLIDSNRRDTGKMRDLHHETGKLLDSIEKQLENLQNGGIEEAIQKERIQLRSMYEPPIPVKRLGGFNKRALLVAGIAATSLVGASILTKRNRNKQRNISDDPRIADRSEAVKKSWVVRKQKYGPSGGM